MQYDYPIMLSTNPEGNYQFIPGTPTFSSGAIALPSYAMVHAIFRRPVALAAAFEAMQSHLAGLGRPMPAVAGIELRSPKPFSFSGFGGFNKAYIDLLQQYGLQLDGKGPAARSNLAPEPLSIAPSEVCVYAFTYTVPGGKDYPQFVAAGSGELRPAHKATVNQTVNSGTAPRDLIVRVGETNSSAMREKAIYCMNAVADELTALGTSWADCTAVNLYTVHPISGFLHDDILLPLGEAAIHGVHWHYTRPPIEEIEFEVDARGVSQEIIL
jgi:hypothetical protein